MAVIKPFRGIRYNLEKIPEIESVVAPPYDVIETDLRNSLYNLHQNNIIRLILGKTYDDDNENNNRYTRASKCLAAWLEDGTFTRDSVPSIYIYRQKYTFNNIESTRTGFISLFKLEAFGSGNIRPHENTLSKPKEDRFRLTKACNARFSQIFSLYDDRELAIEAACKRVTEESTPAVSFCDDSSVTHTLWQVTDAGMINTMIKEMENKEVLIADGHHRYETALDYQRHMADSNPSHTGNEPYNYVMMYLTNSRSKGLSIFPTHRIVSRIPGFSKTDFLKKSEKFFQVEKISVPGGCDAVLKTLETRGRSEKVIGVYLSNNDHYTLSLTDRESVPPASGKSDALKWLDVSILHSAVMEQTLGLTDDSQREQKNITYTVNADEAVRAVDNGDADAAFFLNPTKIEEIQEVAKSGEKMPQKSTFFYPKLKTGLVFDILK